MLTGVVHPCSADAFRVHHFSCPISAQPPASARCPGRRRCKA
jgi:hypothetical protein